jgi:hypothetical protein
MAADVHVVGGTAYRVLADPEAVAGQVSGSDDLVQLELQDPTASRYVWVNPANVVVVIGVPQRPA